MGSSTILVAQNKPYKTVLTELQTLQKKLLPDKRDAVLTFDFRDTLQPKVVLFGETSLPEAKEQIIALLQAENIPFNDSLRLLPSAILGTKTWALANLSVSNMRALPSDASELVSQVMLGTPLRVLDYNNKWYRIQTPEKYIGYMDTAGLKLLTDQEMETWKRANRYVFDDIAGFVYQSPHRNAEIVSDLIMGDIFVVEGKKGKFLNIRFPDGRTGYVLKSQCISFNEWIQREPNAKNITSTAEQMMGSPYLWGGASAKATDCSGYVKLVFYRYGVILTRDASQQFRYGDVVDFTTRENLNAGDLLFFGKSAARVTHVGIYLGDGDFIHSSGRVHISSIDPASPKFHSARNTVGVKRIINAKNTESIVKVKNHPWYCIPQ